MSDKPISEAFLALMDLALARGAKSIKDLPGCHEMQIDEQWWVAINGHGEPTKCTHGPTVEPFGAYITFNGWPAGSMNPYGGIIAAGEAANEDTFIVAVRAAMPQETT